MTASGLNRICAITENNKIILMSSQYNFGNDPRITVMKLSSVRSAFIPTSCSCIQSSALRCMLVFESSLHFISHICQCMSTLMVSAVFLCLSQTAFQTSLEVVNFQTLISNDPGILYISAHVPALLTDEIHPNASLPSLRNPPHLQL